jgi:phage terminase small subunit
MENLNPKQAAFVREYIVDFNATAAAGRAGYSPRTAKSQGQRLLTNVDIQTAIKRHTDAATTASIMEYAEACEILTSVARGNVGDYLDADGCIDPEQLKRHCPQAVQGIDVTTQVDRDGNISRITKFRLADRVRALERLSKLRGWDQPARVQTEDVTPPQYDLSRLNNDELAAFEALLSRVTP